MWRGREWKRNRKEINGEIKRISIPAKAGISAAKPHSPTGDHCNVPLSRNFPLTREEIPAFAGMEEGAGMEVRGRRE